MKSEVNNERLVIKYSKDYDQIDTFTIDKKH